MAKGNQQALDFQRYPMKRYSALLNDTWWVWITLLVAGSIAAVVVSPVFWITIPICAFTFAYFGVMRYDEDGNHKSEMGD